VDQLLEEVWSGPWAVVLNPTWFSDVPQQYSDMVNSWEAAYSLMITATQVRWGDGLAGAGGGRLGVLGDFQPHKSWSVPVLVPGHMGGSTQPDDNSHTGETVRGGAERSSGTERLV
jgi:hypothetical protein